MDLPAAWPLHAAPELGSRLVAAYGRPDRGYHDTRHLAEVLERVHELAAHLPELETLPVVLAAWFHDAVYDGRPEAEQRSAAWAAEALATLVEPAVRAEVVRLVLLTEHHRPAPDDLNGGTLSDADLAILAAGPERYAEYVAGVRAEHPHVPDEQFARARAAVLRDLLAKPHLFHTAPGRAAWEEAARANVVAEVARLEAGLPG